LKAASGDALALRGSADFDELADYRRFVDEVVSRRNRRHGPRIDVERATLRPLAKPRRTFLALRICDRRASFPFMKEGVPVVDEAAASRARQPGVQGGWITIGILFLLYGIAFLDRQVLTLLVDPIRKDLGVTDFQIGLLQGFGFVIFYMIFAIPIGWAVDRFPRRLIIFFGLTAWSLSAAAGGLARSYGQLLAARAGVGAGEASLLPSASSILADRFPKQRLAGAMAAVSAGSVVGGAVSTVLGGLIVQLSEHRSGYLLPLVGQIRPWQLVFMIAGLPGVLLAPLVFLIAEPPRRERLHVAHEASRASILLQFVKGRWRFYLAHFAGFGCFNVAGGGYVAWAATYLIRTFHAPVQKVGLDLGLLALCGGVGGMLFSGNFVDYLFRRGVRDAHFRYYAWACLLMAFAGVTAFTAETLAVAFGGMLVIALIVPFIAVATASLQLTTPNEFRGQVSAAFLFVYNLLGFGLGPALMAGVSDFLLSGPDRLGHAMAIVFGLSAGMASLWFALGLKAMRKAVADAEAWAG
ncbi:MAG: MFS transporter, partial [Caulobacteraceae bacterium]|nr:MFS transporter [Caulobacteraceae bacterium]MBV9811782.1 MFS transporter [Acetobacteraceae bacterium]